MAMPLPHSNAHRCQRVAPLYCAEFGAPRSKTSRRAAHSERCPMAIAPPWDSLLHRPAGQSRVTRATARANASFNSNTSTSAIRQSSIAPAAFRRRRLGRFPCSPAPSPAVAMPQHAARSAPNPNLAAAPSDATNIVQARVRSDRPDWWLHSSGRYRCRRWIARQDRQFGQRLQGVAFRRRICSVLRKTVLTLPWGPGEI